MIRFQTICAFAILMLTLVSCSRNKMLDEIEQTKNLGDKNPQEALGILDSPKHWGGSQDYDIYQYKYHQHQKEVQKLREEKERYKSIIMSILLVDAILLISGGYIILRKRNKYLQQISAMSSELHHISTELSEKNVALKEEKRLLKEKTEQNKDIINLLHQEKLDEKAADIMEHIRLAAVGKKDMDSLDWQKFYHAVDELYPAFKERTLEKLGNITEQQIQVCYLMRIGLSNAQIQNITGLSRTTVWRWMKKNEWALISDE